MKRKILRQNYEELSPNVRKKCNNELCYYGFAPFVFRNILNTISPNI